LTYLSNVNDEDLIIAKKDIEYIFDEGLKKNKDLGFFLY